MEKKEDTIQKCKTGKITRASKKNRVVVIKTL